MAVFTYNKKAGNAPPYYPYWYWESLISKTELSYQKQLYVKLLHARKEIYQNSNAR